MKLNKIIIPLGLGVLALANTACSDIAENERLIFVPQPPVARSVIIEDFTGQRCINCPKATDVIHGLQEEYGEANVIAVGLHGGPFSKLNSGKPTPLYSETADELYNIYAKGMSQPAGMVDRGAATNNFESWSTLVRDRISKESYLKIDIAPADDANSVTIDLEALDGHSQAGNLNVWLIEDNIVSWQYLPDGSRDMEYVHNHVFRTTLTGTSGEAVNVAADKKQQRTYTVKLAEDWKPADMKVVAFVADNSGVLQAAIAPLKK